VLRIGVCVVGLLAAAVLTAAAWAVPRPPSVAERSRMVAALPNGFRICSPRLVAVSGVDARYGAVVAKRRCGNVAADHLWLRRASARPTAAWRVVDRRRGRLGEPPGCTPARGVPLDIRCW
jgi:hypothetical protein